MKIVLDVSRISDNNFLQHQVRGAGFYVNNLVESLNKYFPQNKYLFIERGQKIPKNVDLIHYPYFEPFFLTLPWHQPVKTVVTVHDLTPLVFPEQFPVGIKGKIKWEINKQLLKRVTAIITDSENSKKDICKFTGISSEKISVVYLAAGESFRKLETGNWKLETREKYHLPEKFVLYVGDVTWNKNLPRLIKVVKHLELPLVMVGKALINTDFDNNNPWNKDLVEVQKLARNNPEIMSLGFVPTDDLVKIYNLATVFTMPSIYEGFGLSVLEAMSCGCPVIVGNAGSLPEIVAEAGILVDPNNTEEIRNKLLRILKLSKKEREEMIKKGLAQAKKFSWQKTATETVKVYEKFF